MLKLREARTGVSATDECCLYECSAAERKRAFVAAAGSLHVAPRATARAQAVSDLSAPPVLPVLAGCADG